MKASEIIEVLEGMIDTYGDLEVYSPPTEIDSNWSPSKIEFVETDKWCDNPFYDHKRFFFFEGSS